MVGFTIMKQIPLVSLINLTQNTCWTNCVLLIGNYSGYFIQWGREGR